MLQTARLKGRLVAGASAAAILATAGAASAQTPTPGGQGAGGGSGNVIGEVVVTAQKREEALQDVPIAVSAFTQESLETQGIQGGPNLVQSIPNVTFSRGNFTGYNFQIRGVGSKLVAGSGDAGVGIHLNNAPLTANRLFEAEFYDVERVEVLRGPQGTLYGRNATGGVVNVITNKPNDEFEAELRGEIGNFNARRARGMVNIPIGEMFALRLAGSLLQRDGYGTNLVTGNDIDDRDLYAIRATLGFNQGGEGARAFLLYEHFNEDDNRSRVGKQICQKDTGPATVGGVPVNNPLVRGLLSQGCTPAPINSPQSLGTLNSIPTLGGAIGAVIGLIPGDAYAGKMQNPDLRSIESAFDPIYRASSDVYMLGIDIDVSDSLTLSSLTSFTQDEFFSFADYNRTTPVVPFNSTPLSPGGFFTDPQLGRSNLFRTFDISSTNSEQFTQELRLQSAFAGPINFNVGGIYLDFRTPGSDYFVFSNTLTAAAIAGFPAAGVYVDPTPLPSAGDGRNYFRSTGPYRLESKAAFGEFYWEPTDQLKFTAGLRYTDDKKTVTNFPVGLLTPGRGFDPRAIIPQVAQFKETTGRFGVDWQPELGFTDDTLLYAAYSRGYKAGGLNPPQSVGLAGVTATFAPEFVDSIEVGTKNTLLDGRLLLNLTAFHYDYQGYQISRIVSRTSINDNIDATIQGLEIESIWEPIDRLRFNTQIGLLRSEIADGVSLVDIFDKRQGRADFTYISGPLVGGGCLAPTAQVAAFVAATNTAAGAAAAPLLLTACAGSLRTGTTPATGNPLAPLGIFVDTRDGFLDDISGNELPNSPELTLAIGAEYTFSFGDWDLTPRADYSYQSESFTRIYNRDFDQLESITNLNLNVRLSNEDMGLVVEAYVRNATDETSITDAYLTDDSSGLFRNIFLTEPRTYGIAVQKSF